VDISLQHFDDVLTPDLLREMLRLASGYRKRARTFGGTRVGAVVMASTGELYGGCNIEHRWRCHDIHAEISAISAMVAAGRSRMRAIVVVANRLGLAPCGGCVDWIYEFGGPSCSVGWQNPDQPDPVLYSARELMPLYPDVVPAVAIGGAPCDEST
jgi:cytidine deaminase